MSIRIIFSIGKIEKTASAQDREREKTFHPKNLRRKKYIILAATRTSPGQNPTRIQLQPKKSNTMSQRFPVCRSNNSTVNQVKEMLSQLSSSRKGVTARLDQPQQLPQKTTTLQNRGSTKTSFFPARLKSQSTTALTKTAVERATKTSHNRSLEPFEEKRSQTKLPMTQQSKKQDHLCYLKIEDLLQEHHRDEKHQLSTVSVGQRRNTTHTKWVNKSQERELVTVGDFTDIPIEEEGVALRRNQQMRTWEENRSCYGKAKTPDPMQVFKQRSRRKEYEPVLLTGQARKTQSSLPFSPTLHTPQLVAPTSRHLERGSDEKERNLPGKDETQSSHTVVQQLTQEPSDCYSGEVSKLQASSQLPKVNSKETTLIQKKDMVSKKSRSLATHSRKNQSALERVYANLPTNQRQKSTAPALAKRYTACDTKSTKNLTQNGRWDPQPFHKAQHRSSSYLRKSRQSKSELRDKQALIDERKQVTVCGRQDSTIRLLTTHTRNIHNTSRASLQQVSKIIPGEVQRRIKQQQSYLLDALKPSQIQIDKTYSHTARTDQKSKQKTQSPDVVNSAEKPQATTFLKPAEPGIHSKYDFVLESKIQASPERTKASLEGQDFDLREERVKQVKSQEFILTISEQTQNAENPPDEVVVEPHEDRIRQQPKIANVISVDELMKEAANLSLMSPKELNTTQEKYQTNESLQKSTSQPLHTVPEVTVQSTASRASYLRPTISYTIKKEISLGNISGRKDRLGTRYQTPKQKDAKGANLVRTPSQNNDNETNSQQIKLQSPVGPADQPEQANSQEQKEETDRQQVEQVEEQMRSQSNQYGGGGGGGGVMEVHGNHAAFSGTGSNNNKNGDERAQLHGMIIQGAASNQNQTTTTPYTDEQTSYLTPFTSTAPQKAGAGPPETFRNGTFFNAPAPVLKSKNKGSSYQGASSLQQRTYKQMKQGSKGLHPTTYVPAMGDKYRHGCHNRNRTSPSNAVSADNHLEYVIANRIQLQEILDEVTHMEQRVSLASRDVSGNKAALSRTRTEGSEPDRMVRKRESLVQVQKNKRNTNQHDEACTQYSNKRGSIFGMTMQERGYSIKFCGDR